MAGVNVARHRAEVLSKATSGPQNVQGAGNALPALLKHMGVNHSGGHVSVPEGTYLVQYGGAVGVGRVRLTFHKHLLGFFDGFLDFSP